jgi:integrase
MPGAGRGSSPVRVRLGGFPEITVDDARREASKYLAEMAKGINPASSHRRRKEEATIKDLFANWLERHAKPHKKTWAEDQRQYDAYLEKWKNRKLTTITKADVQALHASMGKNHGTYTANRLLALIRAMFNKADDLGFEGTNPAIKVKPFKEESRDRFLQPEELPRLFRALSAERNTIFRDFVLLALFTGARSSNVRAMRWDELDLERAEWRIPDTKAGRPQVVYLPEPALRLLRDRKAIASGSPWVLPAHGKTGHITEVKNGWKRLLERAGIKNLRVHDLRRTLGSYQAINGASLAIIGASLGHSQPTTTQVYARLTNTAVAESVKKAVDYIVATATPSDKPEETDSSRE